MHTLVAHDDDARAHVAGDARQKDDAVDADQCHRLADVAVPPAQVQLQVRADVHRRRRGRVPGRVRRFRAGRHARDQPSRSFDSFRRDASTFLFTFD